MGSSEEGIRICTVNPHWVNGSYAWDIYVNSTLFKEDVTLSEVKKVFRKAKGLGLVEHQVVEKVGRATMLHKEHVEGYINLVNQMK